MSVFRIHIRPKGGEANPKKSFDYCLNEQVLGMGWPVGDKPLLWKEYEIESSKVYRKNKVKHLKNSIKKDDLIWTRNTEGDYFIGKVISEWEYLPSKDALDADIVNVVRCDLKKVPTAADVPGKVIACFRAPRTFQSIRDNTTMDYSKFLWNEISKSKYFDINKKQFENVFSLLDSEETEDVIFIYLQMNGWIVIPNSRKVDTKSYEFYLIHETSKEKAIVQVKTGNTRLNPLDSTWKSKNEKVYLFQSNGKYSNDSTDDNIVCLSPETIKSFMFANRDLLPSNIKHWLDISEK